MQNYWVLKVQAHPDFSEQVMAELDLIGFDGFLILDDGFETSILEENYQTESAERLLESLGIRPESYTLNLVQQQNWNALWESNFEPILVPHEAFLH